jgi:5-methylcytosine-specific restriction endonuclease McrA
MATNAEYQKAYYWANRERVLAIAKKANAKYLAANKEKEAERKRQYKKNNKEKLAINEARRRARKLAVKSEKYTLEQILTKWGTDCHLCRKPIDLTAQRRVGRDGWENGLHIDHLISLSNGGSDTLENVRPAHGYCNIKKNNKDSVLEGTTRR